MTPCLSAVCLVFRHNEQGNMNCIKGKKSNHSAVWVCSQNRMWSVATGGARGRIIFIRSQRYLAGIYTAYYKTPVSEEECIADDSRGVHDTPVQYQFYQPAFGVVDIYHGQSSAGGMAEDE